MVFKFQPLLSIHQTQGAQDHHGSQFPNPQQASLEAMANSDDRAHVPQEYDSGSPGIDTLFDEDCPYYRAAQNSFTHPHWKKFRLRESFANPIETPHHTPIAQEYIGDSFGDHSYISIKDGCPCSSYCHCRFYKFPCVFTAIKTPTSFDILFHSPELYREIVGVVWGPSGLPKNQETQSLCGFTLLKNRDVLETHLQTLNTVVNYEFLDKSRIMDLTLLVHGLLDDPEMFQSFGYENLVRRRVLSPRAEEAFQNARAHRDLDALEEAYYAVGALSESDSPSTTELAEPTTHTFIQPAPKPTEPMADASTEQKVLSFDELYDLSLRSYEGRHPFPPDTNAQVQDPNQNTVPTPNLCTEYDAVFDHEYRDFSLAAYSGNLELVKSYIDRGFDTNSTRTPFYVGPPLVEAIKHGHEQVVDLLLERGANVNGTVLFRGAGTTFHRPLRAAIEAGESSLVQRLLSLGARAENVLWETKPAERWLVAKALVNHGANSELLLHHAIGIGESDVRLLCVLASSEACPRGAIERLEGWLEMEPSLQTQFSIITQLKEFHDLNNQLISAVQEQNCEGIRDSLSLGADASWGLPFALGNTQLEPIKMLLEAGADSRYLQNGATLPSQSPLLAAAVVSGCLSLTQFFLDLGGSPDALDPFTGECILAKAVQAADHNMVKHLLDRGADANGAISGHGRNPLTEAMRIRDSAIVSLLIRRGAVYPKCAGEEEPICPQTVEDLRSESHDWAEKSCFADTAIRTAPNTRIYPSDTASSRVFPVTLDYESGFSQSLVRAAANGNIIQVSRILTSAADIQREKGLSKLLIDINAIERIPHEMTALMAATAGGHHHILQLLLKHRADVNIITSRGTALSLASEMNSEAAIRALLGERADQHVAELMLRSTAPPGKRPVAIRRLNEVADKHRREQRRQGARAPQKIKMFHSEFQREHNNVMQAAYWGRSRQSAERKLKFLDLAKGKWSLQKWARDFQNDPVEAFATGKRTFDGILNGVLPETLNETIMFLTIAKAISKIPRAGGLASESDFEEDLVRWQLLFDEPSGGLQAFRDAVLAIWGVDLKQCQISPLADAEALIKFQTLARSIIDRADKALQLKDLQHNGLLASQWRWKSSESRDAFFTSPSGLDSPATHSESIEEPSNDQQANSSLDMEYEFPERESINRHYSENLDWLQQYQNRLVILLMAGAIFGIMVAFVLGSQYNHDRGDYGDPSIPSRMPHTAATKKHVEIALEHVFAIAQMKILADPRDFYQIKTEIAVAIQSSRVTSFSTLISFIDSRTNSEWTTIRPYLLCACRDWHSTYQLQENYTTIESYLGRSSSKSIIPQLQIHPRTSLDDVVAMELACESATATQSLRSQPAQHSRATSITATPSSTMTFYGRQSSAASSSETPSSESSLEPLPRPIRKTRCDDCNRDFGTVFNYNKHRKDKHDKVRYACEFSNCPKTFSRNSYRREHELKVHLCLTLGGRVIKR